MDKQNRRTIWIVYPKVQRRMIAIFVLAGSIGFFGLALGAILFSVRLFNLIEPYAAGIPTESQVHLGNLWSFFWVFVVAFGLMYIGMLFFMGLLFSHRVAGPLYRITTQVSEMLETNNFRKIDIRESDFFHNAVEQLNEAIEKRKRT